MKVGEKYIIEIEEVIRRNGAPQIARIKGFNALVFDKCGLEKLEPYELAEDTAYQKGYNDCEQVMDRSVTEVYNKGYEDGKNAVINESEKITSKDISDAYDKGLQDAWEFIIDKVLNIEPEERNKIFNSHFCDVILESFSAKEAIDLYKRWEEQQKQDAEIKVGDEVYSDAFDDKGIVTHITTDKVSCVCIICNGSTMMKVGLHGLHKTGRHFDTITEVLEKLRGEE